MPTAREIDELTRRVEELNRIVAAMRGGSTGTGRGSPRKVAATRPTVKAVRKRAPARKAAG